MAVRAIVCTPRKVQSAPAGRPRRVSWQDEAAAKPVEPKRSVEA